MDLGFKHISSREEAKKFLQVARFREFKFSTLDNRDLEEDEYGNESVNPDTYECECFDIVVVPAVESARLKFTENLNTKPVKSLKQALCEKNSS